MGNAKSHHLAKRSKNSENLENVNEGLQNALQSKYPVFLQRFAEVIQSILFV